MAGNGAALVFASEEPRDSEEGGGDQGGLAELHADVGGEQPGKLERRAGMARR